jgi:hypothetical protein
MKLLLDTHTFIWWDSEPEKLSQRALELCRNPTNILLLSIASVWEMQIKLQLGKRLFGLCDAMDGGYKGWNPYIERHLAFFVNCFLSRAN